MDASFELVLATPDAVRLAYSKCVVETIPTHRAGRADRLCPPLTVELLVLALEVRRREEHDRLRSPTSGSHLPLLVLELCRHTKSPVSTEPTGAPSIRTRRRYMDYPSRPFAG